MLHEISTSLENRKIAISDIHGCCKTFKALLNKIKFNSNDELYLLGDYIDRGPDSKGVIDYIWQLQKEGYQVNCLRGNHEQMMLRAAFVENKLDHWMRNGGETTLFSFGNTSVANEWLPEARNAVNSWVETGNEEPVYFTFTGKVHYENRKGKELFLPNAEIEISVDDYIVLTTTDEEGNFSVEIDKKQLEGHSYMYLKTEHPKLKDENSDYETIYLDGVKLQQEQKITFSYHKNNRRFRKQNRRVVGMYY